MREQLVITKGPDTHDLEKVKNDIAIEQDIREAFANLKGMKLPFMRYNARLALEIQLREKFGISIRLGSIRVTRGANTSRKIFNGEDGRRYVLVHRNTGHLRRNRLHPYPSFRKVDRSSTLKNMCGIRRAH